MKLSTYNLIMVNFKYSIIIYKIQALFKNVFLFARNDRIEEEISHQATETICEGGLATLR